MCWSAKPVMWRLNQIIEWCEKSAAMCVGNGPQYVSGELMEWSAKQEARLEYNPRNSYLERHNQRDRGARLWKCLFETIDEVHDQASEWRWSYTKERPTMGIDGKTTALKL